MPQAELNQIGKKVLVAIGSNAPSHAGTPRDTVRAAMVTLSSRFENFTASPLYETPSFPDPSDPAFVNAACTFDSDLPAPDILKTLHDIEADFLRTRDVRWGQRTLDLDLIAVGQSIAPHTATFDHWHTLPLETQKTATPDQLILPHPRLQDRAFVLVPLADVAPDWVHPRTGVSVTQMLDAIAPHDRRDVVALP